MDFGASRRGSAPDKTTRGRSKPAARHIPRKVRKDYGTMMSEDVAPLAALNTAWVSELNFGPYMLLIPL